ncbi:MAG: helix-turn-helix transcriptional regulator [Clostridiales bacterium]|jgi:transcriptional regulator with XRE-family HTH domain|nr:helix-turn-helix transcriptional regulator [Clostridiales bacterium]
MVDQIKLIADRIKELREISGISTESMAKELNVPVELYLEYESGKIDIPVGFLYDMAKKFNVELTAILTGDEPKLHNFALVRNGKGVVVERTKQYHYLSLAHNFINKKGEPFLVTVDPKTGDEKVVFNSHPGQEFNYMIEGKLKILIDDHELILNEGDSLYFDSTLKHAMIALDDKPAKILAIVIY